jgi:hypothetical protein
MLADITLTRNRMLLVLAFPGAPTSKTIGDSSRFQIKFKATAKADLRSAVGLSRQRGCWLLIFLSASGVRFAIVR